MLFGSDVWLPFCSLIESRPLVVVGAACFLFVIQSELMYNSQLCYGVVAALGVSWVLLPALAFRYHTSDLIESAIGTRRTMFYHITPDLALSTTLARLRRSSLDLPAIGIDRYSVLFSTTIFPFGRWWCHAIKMMLLGRGRFIGVGTVHICYRTQAN